ncbi:ATP-grasp domain-containing protein [Saccharopolyspora sp. CA-218241]|uniref:ATP-grasp domain-containing protein n=1 Tax=Saccharopolyspora sp. CA-218241 TaxID=3240027 RepID=UPI003D97ADD5
MSGVANVFVLGLDDRNLQLVEGLPGLPPCRYHPLLRREEIMSDAHDLPRLLEMAEERLCSAGAVPDALIGYWDFPVTSMVPILCHRHGLPAPDLRAVATCEDKYWSRLEQQRVTTAHPAFSLVDLGPERPAPPAGVGYPMWLKPVKSYSSELAYKAADRAEFDAAVAGIKHGIDRVGSDFDHLLSMLDALPPEIAAAGGRACLAEEEVHGHQLTVEGYCHRGEPHVYGAIDSACYPGTSSFLCYRYPSALPPEVVDRATGISTRVLRRIGLDRCTFNIEFFWDAERDRLDILEINPRLSQSHAPLFAFVDGAPNLQAMVRLALGLAPELPHRAGDFAVAGKWHLRTFRGDAVVRRSPSPDDLARLHAEFPEAIVDIPATAGLRLSELYAQDSYSYELAAVYLGGQDDDDLAAKWDRCVQLLPFELDEEAIG